MYNVIITIQRSTVQNICQGNGLEENTFTITWYVESHELMISNIRLVFLAG